MSKKELTKKKLLKHILNIYTILGFLLISITFILVAIPIAPYFWYRVNPQATEEDIEKITKEVLNIEKVQRENENTGHTVPPIQENLPDGYWVLIPSINVDSPVSSNKDYRKALVNGTWIVPDFGTPEQDSLPIILAAHRFGYSNWSRDTRNKISFFNLPNTEIGDVISIYWNKREYIYKIYGKEESVNISDYNADLILYTCKYFNSPIRIFRYAQRIN